MNINNKTVNTSLSNINLVKVTNKSLNNYNRNNIQDYKEIDYNDNKLLVIDKNTHSSSKSKYATINYKNIDKDNFKPQGFTSNDKYYFIGAYDDPPIKYKISDKLNLESFTGEYTIKKSRIYVYDRKTGEYLFYIETNNKSHMGGVSFDKNNNIMYITNGDEDITALNWEMIDEYLINNKKHLEHHGFTSFSNIDSWIKTTNAKKSFIIDTAGINLGNGLNSSYTYYDDKFLYIGHFNTASDFNDERKVKQFELDYDKVNNKLNIKNVTEFSVPISTQGMATYTNGDTDYIVFSNSLFGSATLDLYERRKNELVPINTYDVTDYFPTGGIEGIVIDDEGTLHTISEFKSFGFFGDMKSFSIPMNILINDKLHKPNLFNKAIKLIAGAVYSGNELVDSDLFLTDLGYKITSTSLNMNEALNAAADNPNHDPLEHTVANAAGYMANSVTFPITSMFFAKEVANDMINEEKSAFDVADDFYSCLGTDTGNIIIDTIGDRAAWLASKSEDFGSTAHDIVHTDNSLISKDLFFTNTGYKIINTSLNINEKLNEAADNPNNAPLEHTVANAAGYMTNSVTFPITSIIFANEVANNMIEEDKSSFEVVDDFYSCLGTDTGNIIIDTIGDGAAWLADKSEDFGSWFHDKLH